MHGVASSLFKIQYLTCLIVRGAESSLLGALVASDLSARVKAKPCHCDNPVTGTRHSEATFLMFVILFFTYSWQLVVKDHSRRSRTPFRVMLVSMIEFEVD